MGSFLECNVQEPMKGVVFGGWDNRMIKVINGNGGDMTFVRSRTGFIRGAPFGRKGPPTIVASMRRVKPGRFEDLMKAYDGLGDYYKNHMPGVCAFTVAQDPKDPLLVHDL
jgi:hypothetical protein